MRLILALLLACPGPAMAARIRAAIPRAALPAVPAARLQSMAQAQGFSAPGIPAPTLATAQESLERHAAAETDQDKARELDRLYFKDRVSSADSFSTSAVLAPTGTGPGQGLEAPSASGQGRRTPPAPPENPRRWIWRAAAMFAVLTALDWVSQYAALRLGWPNAFHPLGSARAVLSVLAVPAIMALAAFKLRAAHRRAQGLAEASPAARRALLMLDTGWAALAAGVAANGAGALVMGGGLDFIPFGTMGLKLGDLWIFTLGAPLLFMATAFLEAAHSARAAGKAIELKVARIYILPVVGLVLGHLLPPIGAALGLSSESFHALTDYSLLYATLLSAGLGASHFIAERLARLFNNGLKQ